MYGTCWLLNPASDNAKTETKAQQFYFLKVFEFFEKQKLFKV